MSNIGNFFKFGNRLVTQFKFILQSTVSVYMYILYTSYLVTMLPYKTIPIGKSLYTILNYGIFGNLVTRAFIKHRQSNLQSYQMVTKGILEVTEYVERFSL